MPLCVIDSAAAAQLTSASAGEGDSARQPAIPSARGGERQPTSSARAGEKCRFSGLGDELGSLAGTFTSRPLKSFGEKWRLSERPAAFRGTASLAPQP